MRDILPDIDRWRIDGKRIALATVIATWGSAPRPVGSRMAVTADGEIAGSVSGGCVEAAVAEACMAALNENRPQLLQFRVGDDTAWNVGLACGGSIDIFVNPLNPEIIEPLRAGLNEGGPLMLVTVVRGPANMLGRELLVLQDGRAVGTLGDEWDAAALMLAREALATSAPRRHVLDTEVEVFVDILLPPVTLVVVGGVHVALPLIAMARTLGYSTVLIDPRAAWGNARRFPQADRLITTWPEEAFRQIEVTPRTAIVALTHDPKLDDPALIIALRSPAFYVGALGSRNTQAGRRERLLAAGVTEAQVSRLHAPIGLDIGAETPQEIALAIVADIVTTLHEAKTKPERTMTAIAAAF